MLLAAGYAVYQGGRWLVGGEQQTAIDFGRRVMHFEERAWFYVEPDVQSWVARSDAAVDLFWFAAHVLVLPVLLLALFWLMARAPVSYLHLRNALGISALLGLLAAWLFPTVPPRGLPGSGVLDPGALRDTPHLFISDTAAMPALHAGWAVALGTVAFRALRGTRWRWLVWLPVMVQILASITTGDDYVLDLIAGVLVTLLPLAILRNQARFRAWWTSWMIPDPAGPTMLQSLRRDRWASLTVVSLTTLMLYMIVGQLSDPGFTNYWGYMMAQIVATTGAVVWLTHRFGPEKGLHPLTHVIVILVTYLDTLGTAIDLYASYGFYDKITHTGGGAILAAAAFDLITSLHQRGAIGWRRSRQISVAILVSVLLGALWELYEFAGDVIFHTGRQSGRVDTLFDLVSDTAGAVLATLLLAWAYRRGARSDAGGRADRPVSREPAAAHW